MRTLLTAGVIAVSLLAGAASASAAIVTADGTGWINSDGSPNAPGFSSGTHNNFTGFELAQYNNWFSFVLPNTTITSATINIFNSASNTTIDPAAVYDLHAASAFTFAGLGAGGSLGSITLGVADDGTSHFVNIAFNAAGLAYLNGNLGSAVYIGGTVTTAVDTTSCNDCIAAFGYTDGNPTATLTLDGAVPEPATWGLMLTGFGLVGVAARRRKVALAA